MPDLRYVGTSAWNRVLLKDDGEFDKQVPVMPGEVVSFEDDVAEKFLSGSRAFRNWVSAGGPEDSYGDKYEPNRFEAVRGNASPYPELEMGSTVQGGRPIFRTEDDNEEGFVVAGKDEGPRSDNEEAILRAEVQEEADKAAQRKREEQDKARANARQQSKQQPKQGQSQPRHADHSERKSEG